MMRTDLADGKMRTGIPDSFRVAQELLVVVGQRDAPEEYLPLAGELLRRCGVEPPQ